MGTGPYREIDISIAMIIIGQPLCLLEANAEGAASYSSLIIEEFGSSAEEKVKWWNQKMALRRNDLIRRMPIETPYKGRYTFVHHTVHHTVHRRKWSPEEPLRRCSSESIEVLELLVRTISLCLLFLAFFSLVLEFHWDFEILWAPRTLFNYSHNLL